MESNSLLRLVRYQWAVVALCLIVGVTFGWVAAQVTPREYTASADVFVTATGGANTGEIAQSTNFSQQQARNFAAISTREVVLQPVIEALDLDTTVRKLRKQVSASVGLNTSVITISATDESPERAAAVANSVSTNLSEVVPALTPRVQGDSPVRLQVIESAVPPVLPSAPNVPLLLVVGLLLGVLLATITVVVRGVLDARVRSADQLSGLLNAPVIGSIGYDRRAGRQPIAMRDRHSLRAEEYRQVRANLRFLQSGEKHKVFAITSANPGEGKSSTSANVAIALAASGLKTCLIEADLRRPSLGGVLDLPDALGFSDVIAGDISAMDALVPWGEDGVKVLLSGTIPPNPSELLESSAAAETLRLIRSHFDVTVIDCPPLNPVSDAAVVARMFGSVIVVGASRVLRVRDLRRAAERLRGVGATAEGAIFNFARVRSSSRYRYESSTREAREPRVPAGPRRRRRAGSEVPIERRDDAFAAVELRDAT
ncbi:polysaccharide biosynthesis tyrosine autokinase [Microbacterium sp. USHLN186]|uniref:polysaccharide biosynthesis tyrosine autokinase n=1 Tax=Microbacterium sp. USHLN186 TaxID=3081286 RepID=UPI003017DC11